MRALRPGDEIVCTRLDHDSNVRPWVIAAERAGATVRFAEPEPDTLELPAAAVEAVLSERTRWVAVTAASNAIGTVPDLEGIVAAAHASGARVYVDAVHATPHRRYDLAALGADVLACSRLQVVRPAHRRSCARAPALLEEFRPDKLKPSPDEAPDRWELGTLPFESLAGVRAAAEYMLELDLDAVRAHEEGLLRRALDGLRAMDARDAYGDGGRPRADADVHRRRAAPRREVAARARRARRSPSGTATTTPGSSSSVLGLAPHGARPRRLPALQRRGRRRAPARRRGRGRRRAGRAGRRRERAGPAGLIRIHRIPPRLGWRRSPSGARRCGRAAHEPAAPPAPDDVDDPDREDERTRGSPAPRAAAEQRRRPARR